MVQKVILLCFFAVGCISAQLQCQHERDEVTAGRNCERACRPDGTCRKQNRECICDGRCGPVCLRKTCPPLAQPGNGSLVYDPSGRFIGSEATYSCDDGFEVVGNAARICHANQTWGGTDPTCQKSTAPLITTPVPATCESLPSPLNGRKITVQEDGDVVENTVARFQCNDGYVKTSGNLRRICREDGSWSGSDVVCSAAVGGQCERNFQEIQNQNRRCVRQCESNSDCLRGRPCVCDDICGPSCIPIDRINHCEDLSSDQSVLVRIIPNNRTFGSIAQYECRNRHEIVGGSNERKCLGSGQWGGDPLTCIPRVRCEQPPEVANSAHNGTKAYYVHGDTVLYRCNFGYYRSGYLPLSRCNRDEWSELQFQCSPKSCGDPGHVLNARRIGASFVFLGSVEYACNPGYELRGLSRRYCQADQQWSGSLPTCHPISCPDPGVPDDGFKIGSDYSYDEIVSYDCNTRYILEGQSSIRCQANATWSAPRPTCRLIQCRRPDEPRNGHSDADLEYYGQQGTIRFDCDNGYTLRGSSVITCNEREQWSPDPPLCLGQCRVPSCPSNGYWTLNNGGRYGNCGSNRMVDPGFHLTYRCNYGYFKCQQIDPLCNDRVWEPQPRNLCVRVGCRFVTLRDPRLRASYTYGGTNECFHPTYHQRDTVIEYSCDRGYKINDGDPNQATCHERSWLPQQQPTCVEVTCPDVQFPYGSVRYQQNGPFSSNRGHTATAHFRCLEGYRLEGNTISCDNGIWNDTIPTCVEEPCSVASLERYDMDVQFEVPPGSNEITAGLKPPGTTANFICSQYGFVASQTKKCERGGWRGIEPQCIRIPCDNEPLENGDVTYTLNGIQNEDPVHGVVRSYDCDAGYTVGDDRPSRCDAGIWTRRLSVCIERPCNMNDLPSGEWNIMYNYLGGRDESAEVMKSPGTVATFTCNRIGYVTVGHNARTCRRGQWNGQNPSCERTTCPPVLLVNGRFEYRDTHNWTTSDPRHGDFIRVTCARGYYLEGATQRRCWDGQWENGAPMCIERPCNTDDLLVGRWEWEIQYTNVGERDGSEKFVLPGTQVTLRCNTTGYETTGRDRRTCRRGEWTGQNPPCERIRCPTTQLDNGVLEYRDIDGRVIFDPKHSDFRNATCNRGYYLQGEEETQCWVGEWDDELPICLEEPCNKEDLPIGDWEIDFNYPAGTNAEPQLMKPASTEARFRCTLLGYVIAEGETKTCRRGEWEGQTPSCERSTCEIFSLKNGRLSYQDSKSVNISVPQHGDYMIATCNDGYHLQGQERTRCWNGEWENRQPTCEDDPCRIFDEEALPNYLEVIYTARNGSIISPANGFFPGKSVANFTCRENGTRIKGNSQRTCKRGDWRGKFPECENDTCPTENIDNGRVTSDDVRPFTQKARHGDWRRFTCNPGYTIEGEERSQCITGEWIPEKPTCTEAFCRIGTIANGEITRQDGSQFTENARHGEWRRVTCDDGYNLVGSMWSDCQSGQWSAENPTCEETPCPAVVNNGEYARILYFGRPSDSQSFPSGATLEVDCAEGRVPEGQRISICRRGFWDPPRLLCVHTAPCQEVPAEDGRTIVYTDNTGNQKQHNSNLLVTCEGHIVRFGQNRSTCLNGVWSPPVAHCKENLALRKDAHQVDTDYGGDAGRAVDGITDGRYDSESCTHTSRNGNNPWWYVNLGSLVLVQEIVIYNRQDNDLHNRLLYAQVRVGDQTTDVTLNSLAGTVNNTETNPIHFELTPAIEGRIVSVSKLIPGIPLTLCEVQVFGEIRGCTNGCQVPHLQNGYFTNIYSRMRLQPMACVSSGLDIAVHCQEGLIREGGHYYRCQQSGEWSKPFGVDSTCQLCPSGNCVVPYIENGHYSNSARGPPLETGDCTSRRYLYVICDNGIHRDGSHFYHCREGELDTQNAGNVFTLCTTGGSRERDQICPSPQEENLVETFVGNDYTPLNGQDTFREGDFITSRCQDPNTQQFQGSVTRRCESGRWSGDPARCALTNFAISVGNTVLKNVTENGTVIVYTVSGFVTIDCKLLNGFRGTINMFKDNVEVPDYSVGEGRNHRRLRINNPSEANSGTYKCEFNGQSLAIAVLFKDIRCPPPEHLERGTWYHQASRANSGGTLGYIFMETVSLNCNWGYRPSNLARPRCSYHSTWINMSHSCIRRY